MSIPSIPIRPTVFLFVVAALVFAGCGNDNTSAPQNVNPLDEVPPLAPSSIGVGNQFTTKFIIDWDDNTEPDLAGYRVYCYDPDPDRDNAYVLRSGAGLLTESAMTLSGVAGEIYIFRVTAVDDSDNESAWSEALSFTFDPGTGYEEATAGGDDSEDPDYDYPQGDDRTPNLPDDQGDSPGQE